MQDLGTLGGNGSAADGINNAGQVVGCSETEISTKWHCNAFLKNPGQPMQDLGTLEGLLLCNALAINNIGQVVGRSQYDGFPSYSHAFLWENGVMYDLNNLTVNLPPGTYLWAATAINDRGWIVGCTYNDSGYYYAFLLTSVGVRCPLDLLLE